jgi:hypothetical protein
MSRFGLPPKEQIEDLIVTRAKERLTSRAERGWPVTDNIIARVCRAEVDRYFDGQVRRFLSTN